MLHSQIVVPCIFRSVSPRLEDNNALKCHFDNFGYTMKYLVIMGNCQNYISMYHFPPIAREAPK